MRSLDASPEKGSSSPRPGEVVGGKYLIEQKLGAGGMGVVVAARHMQLGERVALKFLLPHVMQGAAGEQNTARFMREAQLTARIKSEHVARILDVGARPGGEPFMVMELLEGVDLNKLVRERGPLAPADAADYVLQACEAVAEAHALGIVHRDLKPANLFLTRRPDGSPLVKVLDFGISKLVSGARAAYDRTLTTEADVLGSPLYMAPEQIRNPKGVDARCDVWSLGAILYTLLTGRAAFDADNPATTLALILSDPPQPPRELRPEIPPPLEALILRCLEKDPAERTQTVAELARGLIPLAPPRVGMAWPGAAPQAAPLPAPSSTSVVTKDASTTLGARVTDVPPRSGRRWGFAAMAAGTMIVGGLAAFALYGSAPRSSAASPPPPASIAPQASAAPEPARSAPVEVAASASAPEPVASAAPTVHRGPARPGAPHPSGTASAEPRPTPPKGPNDPLEDRL